MDPVGALTVTLDCDPDGTPVVVLAGDLDLATASSAERTFAALPAPGTAGLGESGAAVVVDMTELTFIDSSGLAVLLRAVKRGHVVRLRRPASWIRQVVVATGLSQTLLLEP